MRLTPIWNVTDFDDMAKAGTRAGTAKPHLYRTAIGATITAAGTGYANGDIIYVTTQHARFRAYFRVVTTGAGGAVTSIALVNGGNLPTDVTGPQTTHHQTGAGTGLVLTLTTQLRSS